MSKLRIARATALAMGFILSITISPAPFAGAEEAARDHTASPRKSYMPPERESATAARKPYIPPKGGYGLISGRWPSSARIIKVMPEAASQKRRNGSQEEKSQRERHPAAGLPTVIRPIVSPGTKRKGVVRRQGPRVITGLPGSRPPHPHHAKKGLPGTPLVGAPHPHHAKKGLPGTPLVGTPHTHHAKRGLPGTPLVGPPSRKSGAKKYGPRVKTRLPGTPLVGAPHTHHAKRGLPGTPLVGTPHTHHAKRGLPGTPLVGPPSRKSGAKKYGPRVKTRLPGTPLIRAPHAHHAKKSLPGTPLVGPARVAKRKTQHTVRVHTGRHQNRPHPITRTPTGWRRGHAHGAHNPATGSGKIHVTRYGLRGKSKTHHHHRHGVRVIYPRFTAFGLPEQTLYPPYYRASQPWTRRPDLKDRLGRSYTARQGSPLRGHIKAGRTVEQGAVTRSHIKGGRTDRQGSPLRSRLVAGRTVQKGSPWSSTMRNWTFRGYQAPMRPKGISYYRPRW